jgi:hypothetical protein
MCGHEEEPVRDKRPILAAFAAAVNRCKALARTTVLGVMIAGSLMFALPAAGAHGPTRDNNCVHPSGVSFNELLDVPEQFVNLVCSGLTAGEHWRPSTIYTGAAAADAIYPPGYTLHAEPVDDFVSKLPTIKMVVTGNRPGEDVLCSPPPRRCAPMCASFSSILRRQTCRRRS